MTGAIRKVFHESPEQFDPRKYLGPARDAMKEVCKARMIAFGQAGHAGEIPTKTCKEMVDFYAG
jgi:fructose-bisphosphate aldolase class II